MLTHSVIFNHSPCHSLSSRIADRTSYYDPLFTNGEPEQWFSTASPPRATGGIRNLKAVIGEGKRVTFRRPHVIWARQGPGAHRRTNPDGVILSGITIDGEDSLLAKQVDKAKSLFLSMSGNDHTSIDTFQPYRLSPELKEAVASTLQKAGSEVSDVSARCVAALSYGGGIVSIRDFGGCCAT